MRPGEGAWGQWRRALVSRGPVACTRDPRSLFYVFFFNNSHWRHGFFFFFSLSFFVLLLF